MPPRLQSRRGDSPLTAAAQLLERIRATEARIGIIGLGYVGLPLAVEFAHAGFDVTGFDVDESKNTAINAGQSYIPDVPVDELASCVRAGRLRATSDMSKLGDMDVIDICVPTPLRKTKDWTSRSSSRLLKLRQRCCAAVS